MRTVPFLCIFGETLNGHWQEVEFFQVLTTSTGKVGSNTQKLWNLNGLFRRVVGLGWVSIRTGQWSEWQQVGCVTLALGYKLYHFRFTKKRLILSWIRSFTSLRFVQLNLKPEKPKSIMLHMSRHSLNKSDLFTLMLLPPNLSLVVRGSLKSPEIT